KAYQARDNQTYAFGERYELAEKSGTWQIVRFRYWPLRPDTGKEFGALYFEELDAKIEEERRRGDERQAAYDLLLAYRFDELTELVRRLTDQTPDDPWAWKMRAVASAMIGDRADAERASQTERMLEGR